MGKTHWKSLADSSQYLGKQHFAEGEDKIVTIEELEESIVENAKKRTKEVKRVLHFVEPETRPLILNSTNGKRIEKLLESPYKEDWVGKRIILFVDKSVPNNFDPENPGGIRVRTYLPKIENVICEGCGKPIKAHGDWSVNKIAMSSRASYGKDLCWDCSIQAKEAANAND